MIDRALLSDMLRLYVAQPASAVWRAVEIGALLRLGIPAGRGLDLGCGDGKLTRVILDHAGPRKLVGFDPDPLETAAARTSGVYETVHTASGSDVPEPDASFDFVISNSVLEHIPDLPPVLAEVARLLRPGGQFLFTVPAPGFHTNLRGSLMPGVTRARYLRELDERLAHFRYPSSSEWQTLCQQSGLVLENCLGYLDRDETRTWETMSRFTGGLLYALSGKAHHPIRIQRALGLRQLQNRTQLPRTMAAALSALIGRHLRRSTQAWLPEADASCLLVYGRRA
jgi:SAM-dependent methyltransferase